MQEVNGAVIYAAAGTLATGEEWGGWSYMGYSDFDILGWGPAYVNTSKSILIQFASPAQQNGTDTWSFSDFDGMQCNINFRPETFSVFVNNTAKQITATPMNDTSLSWPAYGDKVLDQVKTWLWALSYIDACVGGCQLGRALRLNVNRLQNVTRSDNGATISRGSEDFLASIVDNTIVTLLNTRMVSGAPQATKKVDMAIGVPAFVFGDVKFVYLVVAINLIVTAIYVIECLRTRAWAGIPQLDITNVSDLLISAYRGGMSSKEGVEMLTVGFNPTKYGEVHLLSADQSLLTQESHMTLKHDLSGTGQAPIILPVSQVQHGKLQFDNSDD